MLGRETDTPHYHGKAVVSRYDYNQNRWTQVNYLEKYDIGKISRQNQVTKISDDHSIYRRMSYDCVTIGTQIMISEFRQGR